MSETTHRLPPHSLSAEQAVIGGLMLDNDRWDDITALITEAHFYTRANGLIFAAIQALLTSNKPADLVTLTEFLEQQGTLDQCGGFAYLAEVSKNTPSAANIVAYAEYVAGYSQKRHLLALGHDLTEQAADPRSDLASLLAEAEQRLFSIAEQQAPAGEFDLCTSLESFLEGLEQRCRCEDQVTGTPTGFSRLDSMTSGLQSGDLILLAGRPSMGKTALGLAFCENALALRPDDPVQIYSLEMPSEQLLMRFTAMLGRVPLQHLRNGDMDDEDWGRTASAMKILMESRKDRLVIDDSAFMTPFVLRSRVRRNIRRYGRPSLILLDYLQLMSCPGQENRTQEVAEISRSLKVLAKECGCPVVALSQLNRSLESRADKRPNNGDLRDSGALEQDADLILFLYRDEVYNAETPDRGMAEIILGKQRNGPIGTVKVPYHAAITLFEDDAEADYGC